MEITDEVEGMFGTISRTERLRKKYFEYKRHNFIGLEHHMSKLYILYGPQGTGKTRWMDDTFGPDGWTRVSGKGIKWFDNCDYDVVLLVV
jgi:hypothetical protein